MPRFFLLLLSAFSASLVACAAQPAPPQGEWRVMVKLAQAGSDADTIARRAGEASGVPVRYLAAVSPQWHGLGLACGDEARCAQAMQRLRDDKTFFEVVERDEHRHRLAHPS